MDAAEIGALLGAALSGALADRFGFRGISRKPDKERIIEMLETMQKEIRADRAAARAEREEWAQQLEQIGEKFEQSQDMARQALFRLLDWIKREPPSG